MEEAESTKGTASSGDVPFTDKGKSVCFHFNIKLAFSVYKHGQAEPP